MIDGVRFCQGYIGVRPEPRDTVGFTIDYFLRIKENVDNHIDYITKLGKRERNLYMVAWCGVHLSKESQDAGFHASQQCNRQPEQYFPLEIISGDAASGADSCDIN